LFLITFILIGVRELLAVVLVHISLFVMLSICLSMCLFAIYVSSLRNLKILFNTMLGNSWVILLSDSSHGRHTFSIPHKWIHTWIGSVSNYHPENLSFSNQYICPLRLFL
jgi:hypothetical protein